MWNPTYERYEFRSVGDNVPYHSLSRLVSCLNRGVPDTGAGNLESGRPWSDSGGSAYEKRSHAGSNGRWSCDNAQNHQSHVVVLLGAGGEGVSPRENALQYLVSGQTLAPLDHVNHALLAPLFVCLVHSFADAVGVGHQHITGRHRNSALLVGIAFEQAHNYAADLQPRDRPLPVSAVKEHGRVVTGVHVIELPRRGMVLTVKERRVTIRRRGLVDQVVYVSDGSRQILRIPCSLSP